MKKLCLALFLIMMCSLVSCTDTKQTQKEPKTTTATQATTEISTTATQAPIKITYEKPTTTAVSTTTIKTTKTQGVKKDIIVATNYFYSVEEMVKKANSYKTLSDVYKDSKYDEKGQYYMPFTEKKLKCILKDREILVPKFPRGTKIQKGYLTGLGKYVFVVTYKKTEFWITVPAYKNGVCSKGKSLAFFEANIINECENSEYCWDLFGYEMTAYNISPKKDEITREFLGAINIDFVELNGEEYNPNEKIMKIDLKEWVPFDTIDEMIAEAKTFKTMDDLHKAANAAKDDLDLPENAQGGFLRKFDENTLSRILVDRKIYVPVFPETATLIEGELSVSGRYYFSVKYKDLEFNLWISNARETDVDLSKLSAIYNINGVDIYRNEYEYDRDCYWYDDGYKITLSFNKTDDAMEKEFIENLSFYTVDLDQ